MNDANAGYAKVGKSAIWTNCSVAMVYFGAGIWISSYPFFDYLNEFGGNVHFSFDIKCPNPLNTNVSKSIIFFGVYWISISVKMAYSISIPLPLVCPPNNFKPSGVYFIC